mmetsp:Transcript_53891/g.172786  ORF Transcript_53891/g.172786 Transcript_53891/m.172786 type:complete len:240 (+) Transcript_53891:1997-2716(+)
MLAIGLQQLEPLRSVLEVPCRAHDVPFEGDHHRAVLRVPFKLGQALRSLGQVLHQGLELPVLPPVGGTMQSEGFEQTQKCSALLVQVLGNALEAVRQVAVIQVVEAHGVPQLPIDDCHNDSPHAVGQDVGNSCEGPAGLCSVWDFTWHVVKEHRVQVELAVNVLCFNVLQLLRRMSLQHWEWMCYGRHECWAGSSMLPWCAADPADCARTVGLAAFTRMLKLHDEAICNTRKGLLTNDF